MKSRAKEYQWHIEWREPSELIPYEYNAKLHDDKQVKNIANSIKRFGWQQPAVVTNDDVLIIGHGRRLAALKLKCKMPVKVIEDDLTEDDIKELRLADNLTNESGWDYDLRAFDAENLSFEGFDFDLDVLSGGGLDESDIVEDETPEAPAEPVSKRGNIWQLGRHRLMCGDSTSESDVAALMDGEKADIAFTSPPYNAGTTSTEVKMGKKTKYDGADDNKTQDEYRQFINDYLRLAFDSAQFTFMNVQSLANNKQALIDVLYDNRDKYADTLIWDKGHGQPAMAENVLNSAFEYIHVFSGKANRAIGTLPFRGTIDNILHIGQRRGNEFSNIHNATFSVEFAAWFVSRFAEGSVLDSFGGTGTTMIACEQLGKKCFMMEYEPKYCDVIIQRWENLTGEKAVLLNG